MIIIQAENADYRVSIERIDKRDYKISTTLKASRDEIAAIHAYTLKRALQKFSAATRFYLL